MNFTVIELIIILKIQLFVLLIERYKKYRSLFERLV